MVYMLQWTSWNTSNHQVGSLKIDPFLFSIFMTWAMGECMEEMVKEPE